LILIDAGPLIALVDADDQYHSQCVDAFRAIREPLGTVWPAITEAMYLLADLPPAQDAIWEMISRSVIQLLPLTSSDVPRMRELMRKYADRRMDLADAALVAVAERESVRTIFTVDTKDFSVYRLHGRLRFALVPRP
jgi:predicted nucleic acid-binding protein